VQHSQDDIAVEQRVNGVDHQITVALSGVFGEQAPSMIFGSNIA
jgi:hypothetical protein